MALEAEIDKLKPIPESEKQKIQQRLMDILSFLEFAGQVKSENPEQVKTIREEIKNKKIT